MQKVSSRDKLSKATIDSKIETDPRAQKSRYRDLKSEKATGKARSTGKGTDPQTS